jgi:exopolysaccharide production protein ExoQ
MPPLLALIIWFVCLALLFRFDPAKEPKMSVALWVPILAIFFVGSRNPTQWFAGQVSISAQSFEEGSPIDRVISLGLILLAVGILSARSFKWGEFFTRNIALSALISFGLLSVMWSDFPFVAFKRWFRDVGNLFFILVILSDSRPFGAVRTVLRRICYLLIPLSILLDKYFPEYSRSYSAWSGAVSLQGATTSKNMLGLACLVSGLFFVWDSAVRWSKRKEKTTKRILAINAAFLLMTLALLSDAHSTTSSVCLCLGVSVIVLAYSKTFRRHPKLLMGLLPATFLIYLVMSFGLDMSGSLAQSVGKDPTLTDRTKIWAFLLNMHTNPIIGTGYQSFWLGWRLQYFWNNAGLGYINEAHNGYLGLYLNEGFIGVGILVVFLFASYRLICGRLTRKDDLAVLGLAGWISIVFYNMSEQAFEGGLLYLVFLILGISVPVFVRQQRRTGSVSSEADHRETINGYRRRSDAMAQWPEQITPL